MKSADAWFDHYAESHQNPTNKLIHWVCIPLIYLSTVGLVQSIPFPVGPAWLDLGLVGVVLSLFFYGTLSWTICLGMGAIGLTALGINHQIAAAGLSLPLTCVAIFVAAWIGQFIGHKIEGKKPSFFEDLQFLLVGPAWLLQFVYRKVGIPVTPGVAAA